VYYFLLRGELSKRSEEAEHRRSFTARRISAWVEDSTRLIVQNAGEESVYALSVYVAPIDASTYDVSCMNEILVGTLAPGTKTELPIDRSWTTRGHSPEIPQIALRFTRVVVSGEESQKVNWLSRRRF
jgi:hypothetical protein